MATVTVVNLNAYTPAETIELVSRAGAKKARMRPDKIFLSAVSAGCLLSFAGAASLIVTTAPWFDQNAPGLLRLVGALVFPLGLVLIALTGADLFTGSNMFTAVAFLHGRLSLWRMLMHWLICFFGNLGGALFVMAIIVGYGATFEEDPYRANVISSVTAKQIVPQFHQIFLRGIGCNWLVCLSLYLATQGKDLTSKVIGLWWPIFAFVVLGFDHVVANMFFIPLGLWVHTPGLTVRLYIWKGIVPTAIGNMVGGALFCGGYYWWMYLFREEPILIDGTAYRNSTESSGLFGTKRWSGHHGRDRESSSTEV